MITCDHRYGFKRRDTGTHYCPVCRAEVYPGISENIGDPLEWECKCGITHYGKKHVCKKVKDSAST